MASLKLLFAVEGNHRSVGVALICMWEKCDRAAATPVGFTPNYLAILRRSDTQLQHCSFQWGNKPSIRTFNIEASSRPAGPQQKALKESWGTELEDRSIHAGQENRCERRSITAAFSDRE
ncbi:hypothetical protein Bbelb_154380 [Branchiostoma belcheri]|nr:hypothetical protein Bbelb_154380 [Branchiostoma belcheri]